RSQNVQHVGDQWNLPDQIPQRVPDVEENVVLARYRVGDGLNNRQRQRDAATQRRRENRRQSIIDRRVIFHVQRFEQILGRRLSQTRQRRYRTIRARDRGVRVQQPQIHRRESTQPGRRLIR